LGFASAALVAEAVGAGAVGAVAVVVTGVAVVSVVSDAGPMCFLRYFCRLK
jgi:hypothetical protein